MGDFKKPQIICFRYRQRVVEHYYAPAVVPTAITVITEIRIGIAPIDTMTGVICIRRKTICDEMNINIIRTA